MIMIEEDRFTDNKLNENDRKKYAKLDWSP